jgi:formate dehydrogenase major subunit
MKFGKQPAPVADINEDDLEVHKPKTEAAGVKAVMVAVERAVAQAGVTRTAQSLLRLNQRGGFDCPGCAWPESDKKRKAAEFCENGAKAVAEENTLRTVGAEFWARHSVAELSTKTEYWLGNQGRLSEPVVIRPGETHYSPISWSEAFELVGEHVRATTADRCVFYTSGRTANETVFMYQLFARALGTNNLPDCSNMCHESSGSALNPTIGIGKGTVSLEDIHDSELIFVVGQNPGTNHPRMLSALKEGKDKGGKVVAVNPLPEAGLFNFKDPQTVSGVVGGGIPLADEYLQIKVGGDLALFQALGHLLLEEEERNPGTVVDHSFIAAQTDGFDATVKPARSWTGPKRRRPPGCPGNRSRPWPECSSSPKPPSSAGPLGSRSSRTRWTPSRKWSTSCCCRETSASQVPAPARSAGTPTSRATGPWASGKNPRNGS